MLHAENQIKLHCVTFSGIHTSKQGSIFDLSNFELVEITCCLFNDITSTSYPGCFRVQDSSVKVKRCSFADCSGVGTNDAGYGNAYFCKNCNDILNEVSVIRCPSQKSQYADSPIVFDSSKSLELSMYNASDNYGSFGTASVAILLTDIETNKVNFTTVKNPHDNNSFEARSMSFANIHFFNFIDSENCLYSCLSLTSDVTLNIFDSIFINPHNRFSAGNGVIQLYDCYTNRKDICTGCENLIGSEIQLIDFNYGETCNKQIECTVNCQKYGYFLSFLVPVLIFSRTS